MNRKRKASLDNFKESKLCKFDFENDLNLKDLPLEIIANILSFLDFKDIKNVTSTCKLLNQMTNLVTIPLINFRNFDLFQESQIYEKKYANRNFQFEKFKITIMKILNRFDNINNLQFSSFQNFHVISRSPIPILRTISKKIKKTKKITLGNWVLRSNAFDKSSLDSYCTHLESLSMGPSNISQNKNFENIFKNVSSWTQLTELTINCIVNVHVISSTLKKCINLKKLDLNGIEVTITNDSDINYGVSRRIICHIINHCTKLKNLILPTCSYWTRSVSKYLLTSSLKLDVLCGSIIHYQPNRRYDENFVTQIPYKNVLNNLTHLQSENSNCHYGVPICNLKQIWLLSSISEKLVVFNCEWFFLLGKYIIKLSKICPNLKTLGGSCHSSNSDGYLLRLIRKFHPNLNNLYLNTHPWNWFDEDPVDSIGKAKIYMDEDDLLDILQGFTQLKEIRLQNEIITDKTRQSIIDMGIDYIDV